MKNLLIVGMSSAIGGVESFIMNYFRNFNNVDIKCFFLAFKEKIAFSEEIILLKGNILTINTTKFKNPLQFLKELKKIFRIYKFDVVWLNDCSLGNAFILKYAAKNKCTKRIVHSHNSRFMKKGIRGLLNIFMHFLGKIIIKKYATDYWTCSDKAGKFFYNNGIRTSNKYKIIPNAIRTDIFCFDPVKRKALRNALGLNDKFIIGHIGRFHFQKNHVFLIDVFMEIKKINKNAVLLLVGTGDIENIIRQKVINLNLKDSVMFLGSRRDVNSLMSAMDMFILPSLFEGLPIVGVEAQCSGLPCFFSNEVTDEIIITDLALKISLTETVGYWADVVLSKYKNGGGG